MALSSQWSQAVVVRATSTGEVIVPPQPNNGTARAMAASGNPIIVRARTAENFGGGLGSGNGESSRSGRGEAGASGGPQGFFSALLVGYDVSQTFWVPDPAKGEMGLLEHLARRGSANRSHVLLQSRPMSELQCNFSTCTGYNIDLGHNMFRLSKTAMALQHMDATLGDDGDDEGSSDYTMTGTASAGSQSPRYGSPNNRAASTQSQSQSQSLNISTRAFKATMRASLQSLQEEDFYLVRYRDYSAWAVSEYRGISKTDSMFGRKYVEQCFAVHVGREPGELIPMTESQFLYGVDLLQRQLMNQLSNTPARPPAGWGGGVDPNQSSYQQYQVDVNYSALNADQFRSLGALLGDGMRQVGVEGEERKREEQIRADARARRRGGEDDYDYTPPAWYDWSPGAIRSRVQHRLRGYYRSVGQLTVQLAVLGICGFFLYRAVKDYLPGGGTKGTVEGDRRGSDRRRGGRGGRGDYDRDYGYAYRPGLLRSILMGPKEVFDYMLAPQPERH